MKKILLAFCIIIFSACPCEMALANIAASCPDKTLSTHTLKGKYIKDVLYEYGYHFLMLGQDEKIYDIGIGQDTIAEFEGIEPGNVMTIPVSKKQRFDSTRATCLEYYEFTPTPTEKGSYTSGKVEIIDPRVTIALYKGNRIEQGYTALFTQENEHLTLFASPQLIQNLKGHEGKSMEIHYDYTLSFNSVKKRYVLSKKMKSFSLLPDLSPEQLRALRAKLLARKGPQQELLNLGAYYQYGLRGIKKNGNKAFEWYKKIAEFNTAEAWMRMGDMCQNTAYVREEYYSSDSPKIDDTFFDADTSEEEASTINCFSSHGSFFIQAIKAGYTPAITRHADLRLVQGIDNDSEKYTPKEAAQVRRKRAIAGYTHAAKLKDIDAQERLQKLGLPFITKGFLAAQGPCPSEEKTNRNSISGKFIKQENYEEMGFGFFVQGNNGELYEIVAPSYAINVAKLKSLQPGQPLTLPFHGAAQYVDDKTGICKMVFYYDEESTIKSPYFK